ncbi:MAG: class I tRNA ligase family protein [Candidatus Saccharimonadales bacterium]
MKRYNPSEIEPKWQKIWADTKLYAAKDFDETHTKYVMLTEFPYASGDGLHLGHVREYTLGDILARWKRMSGYNVLYPMGYDAFGLPTENFAIKNKIAPQVASDRNIGNFQKQFDALGVSVDWDRSIRTDDPKYYKWTQWLFLQFFKKGLAYQEEIAINWCPKCKTGLANEEVVNGRHERCDTPVEKKLLKQWLLKITKYADRLIDGLEAVDYPSRIADQQINWIGRSRGAEVDFKVAHADKKITIFTTRPDTLFGATFMVLAPEHPLVKTITTDEQRTAVETYVAEAGRKSEIDRMDTSGEKTGVFTGAYAVNPAGGEQIPIWIADYVLMGYGTGAIMAVPAHDQRDFEFAAKFDLPIQIVIEPTFGNAQGDETHKKAAFIILHNPKTNKVIVLDWGPRQERFGGKMLIGGGLEGDESFQAAAQREIIEETGYKNFKFVREADFMGHGYFYSNTKHKNMHVTGKGLLYELIDEERVDTNLDDGEKDKFKVTWQPVDKVAAMLDDGIHEAFYRYLMLGEVYCKEGLMVNSGIYDGMASSEAREKIVADLTKKGVAKEHVNYRLHDWIFSRQHYWGEPIPIIHCPKDGAVAVPNDQLPVELPPVEHYEPTDTGESPLAAIEEWVSTTCPKCGSPAKRETDTMPNWAGSSWYYLRYYDAHNDKAFAESKKLDYWGEVDLYLGGMEHTTLHLLYSRFWHQFLYDQDLVPTPEPYKARRGQGIILAEDGSKMSKSKGNVVNPNDIIDAGYGADALRLAIAFLAPYDQTTPWSSESVAGTYRFLSRAWTLVQEAAETEAFAVADTSGIATAELSTTTNAAIKKVSQDLHEMGFNTAIASLMEFTNTLYKLKKEVPFTEAAESWKQTLKTLVQLLAPFAPHAAEELWQRMGEETSVHISGWPEWDEVALKRDLVTIVVQVNGKVRANLQLSPDATQEEVEQAAKADEKVQQFLSSEPKKVIYVPGRLVNFVV